MGDGMSYSSIWLVIAENRGTGKKVFTKSDLVSGKQEYLTAEEMEKELIHDLRTQF